MVENRIGRENMVENRRGRENMVENRRGRDKTGKKTGEEGITRKEVTRDIKEWESEREGDEKKTG